LSLNLFLEKMVNFYSFFFLQFDRRTLSVAIRFLRAKTPEQRAAVDLDTHYSRVKDAFDSLFVLLHMYSGYLTGEEN